MTPPLPPDLDRRLTELATRRGLSSALPALRGGARQAWRLEPARAGSRPRAGGSRLGGLPDLPDDWSWPRRDGQPLRFVAQLDLAEVPGGSGPLPAAGWLYFFVGEEAPAWDVEHHVAYAPPGARLRRQDEPTEPLRGDDDDLGCFSPVEVGLRPTVSLPRHPVPPPDDDPPDGAGALQDDLDGLPAAPAERSYLLGNPYGCQHDPAEVAYLCTQGHPDLVHSRARLLAELDDDIRQARAAGRDHDLEALERRRAAHQEAEEDLVNRGVMRRVPPTEEELASLEWWLPRRREHAAEIGHWQVLLQVDSHRAADMGWWDSGHLIYLIDDRDLAAGRWQRTHAVIESG